MYNGATFSSCMPSDAKCALIGRSGSFRGPAGLSGAKKPQSSPCAFSFVLSTQSFSVVRALIVLLGLVIVIISLSLLGFFQHGYVYGMCQRGTQQIVCSVGFPFKTKLVRAPSIKHKPQPDKPLSGQHQGPHRGPQYCAIRFAVHRSPHFSRDVSMC